MLYHSEVCQSGLRSPLPACPGHIEDGEVGGMCLSMHVGRGAGHAVGVWRGDADLLQCVDDQ